MTTTSIMRILPPAAADRLIKVIGMFGSAHDGEVVAAARQATKILQAHRMSWSEFLTPIAVPQPPARAQHRPAPRQEAADWRSDVAACLACARRLTDWELEFVTSLQGFRRLAPKQAAVLDHLIGKVRTARGAP